MVQDKRKRRPPALIIVGGFAGAGKTTVFRRLSADFSIPRLGSDTIGRTVKKSAGVMSDAVNAYWIAYDVLFRLCEEFVESGVSTVLDLTMGWESQRQQVDGIIHRHPETLFLPLILRCPHARCMERIRRRYATNPEYYDPPEYYTAEPNVARIWQFLVRIDRPDVRFVDAKSPHDEVYDEILKVVSTQLMRRFEPRKMEG